MKRRGSGLVMIIVCGMLGSLGAAATLPYADGFEGAGESWKLGAGVSLAEDAAVAREGSRFLRCACVKPEAASSATLSDIPVKPRTGYVLRAWVRFDGGAQYTLGVLNPGDSFFVCRDMYGFGDRWEEIIVPFRTEEQTRLSIYAGRRYGTGAVLYDSLRLVEDDTVQVGDVSPAPNPFPKLTAAEETRGYVLSAQPWLRPLSPRFAPLRGEIGRALECRLAPGEAEPLSLAVTATRPLAQVQVALAGDLQGPGKRRLPARSVSLGVVRAITRWTTNSAPLKPGQRFERVPLLIYPNQPVDVPARETRQVWVTVQAGNTQAPGVYEGKLTVAAAGAEPASVPLRVTVLPVKLSPAKPVYGMYYRHSEQPKGYQTEAFFQRCLADMKAHGMNSFCLYAYLEKRGADGVWQADLEQGGDPYSLPRQMAALQRAGILDQGHPLMLLSMESATRGRIFTEDRVVRAADALRRERGWPEFVWYLVDEPGPDRYDAARELTGYVHRVPGVRTTTAGVPEELAACYDVWIQGALRRGLGEHVRQCLAAGKEPWTYNCTWNGSQPANDRYYTGYFMWATGMRGNWQWCYTEGQQGSSRLSDELEVPLPYYEEPWYVQYVLPTPEGNLPTMGWEGRREGIDDYRYLQTLAEAVARVRQTGSPSARKLATEAQQFLDRVKQRCAPPPQSYPGTNSSQNYGFVMHPGLAAGDYEALRRQAADYLVRLQGSR